MKKLIEKVRQMAPWSRFYLVAALIVLTFPLVPDVGRGGWAMLTVSAVAIGFSIRMKPFVARLWESTVARILFYLGNVVVLQVSHVLASHTVSAGLGLSPVHFDHTVNALTLVYVVALLATVAIFVLSLLSPAMMLFGAFHPAFHRDPQRGLVVMGHSLGALALVGFISTYVAFPLNWTNHPPSWLTRMAVAFDFYPQVRTPGVLPGERVAVLDDGWLAIATVRNDVVAIRLRNAAALQAENAKP